MTAGQVRCSDNADPTHCWGRTGLPTRSACQSGFSQSSGGWREKGGSSSKNSVGKILVGTPAGGNPAAVRWWPDALADRQTTE
jgi:hypothetical protein